MKHQVVILCGGLGTRVAHMTENIPKSMIRFQNVPFLEILIKQLANQRFDNFLLLTGHRAEVIKNYFGTGSALGIKISYSCEPVPLGTGGALRLAKPMIKDRFLLLYGDIYREFDYSRLDALDTNFLAVYKYQDGLHSISAPNIQLSNDLSYITDYRKETNVVGYSFVDAGFGYFSKHVVDLLPNNYSNWESVVYPVLSNAKELRPLIVDKDFYDIGNVHDLEDAKINLRPLGEFNADKNT